MLKSIMIFISMIIIKLVTSQVNLDDREVFAHFEKFLKQFNKSYTNMEEFNRKYEVFKNNFFLKENLNIQRKNRTKEIAEENLYGISEFMDLTPEEFTQGFLKLNSSILPNVTNKFFNTSYDNENQDEEEEKQGRFLQYSTGAPPAWDWRLQGAVNPVQNQGSCGGCWAFVTVSNLEGVYFKKYGVLPKFSEQQLIDCDPYSSGCNGGIIETAFNYIQTNGIALNSQYPYRMAQGYCQYTPYMGISVVAGYQFAGTTSEKRIKEMLYQLGPLAITMNASTLQYYTGGIIDLPNELCPVAPNHGVTLVGYGESPYGQKYWIIRNTWGPYWGEGGYFRIVRGRGLCGINQYVISAIVN
jgi:cathepsin F